MPLQLQQLRLRLERSLNLPLHARSSSCWIRTTTMNSREARSIAARSSAIESAYSNSEALQLHAHHCTIVDQMALNKI